MTTENKIAFEKAFLAAQKATEAATKDALNPFFKSRYANYEAVVLAIKKPLNDNGISFRHTSSYRDGLHFIGTQLTHAESGEKSEVFELPMRLGSPQENGSALTYLRRYTLSAITGLTSEMDDDGNLASKKTLILPEIYEAKDAQKLLLKEFAERGGCPAPSRAMLAEISAHMIGVPMDRLAQEIRDYIRNPLQGV